MWSHLAPRFDTLLTEPLDPDRVPGWLDRWSDLQKEVWEARAGLKRDRARNLLDERAQTAYRAFVEKVFTPFQVANGRLAARLLALPGYEPGPDEATALRVLRSAAPVSEASAPLSAEIDARADAYAVRVAAGTADRAFCDDLFLDLVARRRALARAAGFPDYRAYRWRELGRTDYTPDDCLRFHDALAAELAPVVACGPRDEPPATSLFADPESFADGMAPILTPLDPELGALLARMREEDLLDLGARPDKLAGGEEWLFPVTGLPYVHLNADGTREGCWSFLHEMGHAFHDFRAAGRQRRIWDIAYPDEFAEFAAMTLALLGAERLPGGVRTLLRRYIEWPLNGARIDAFQHQVYTQDPADLDALWATLTQRFVPWSAGDDWRDQRLLFSMPFYNFAYDLAELGAVQVWRAARRDPAGAWSAFKESLALGATRSLPELFHAAGAQLPFDRAVVRAVAREVAAFV